MLNNKGFSEVIRVVIIVSFIAVIYMVGIYIWQYIETHKRVNDVISQLNSRLEEQLKNNKETINFDFNNQGGCANIYLYSFNKERTNSIVISIDVKKLDLLSNKKESFDINTEGIDLKFYRGEFLGYLHCTNKLDSELLEYEVLEARSGQVDVMLDNYNLVDQYIGDLDYQATVILHNVIFLDINGEEIYIDNYKFDSVEVGWTPE